MNKFTAGQLNNINSVSFLKQLNDMVDAINKANNLKIVSNNLSIKEDNKGKTYILKNSNNPVAETSTTLVRSAKITAVNSDNFSVRLLDTSGAMEATTYTVYPIILNAANLASSSFPRLTTNHTIQVYKDFEEHETWKTNLIFDVIINVNNFY